jgi:hypothetical protein
MSATGVPRASTNGTSPPQYGIEIVGPRWAAR